MNRNSLILSLAIAATIAAPTASAQLLGGGVNVGGAGGIQPGPASIGGGAPGRGAAAVRTDAVRDAFAKGGVTVSYNGVFESLQSTSSVQLPISNLIFSDTSVHGFDLNTWATTSPDAFRAGVSSVLGLVGDKKVVLKPAHVFSQAEFAKALEEVQKSGVSVALKH